MPPIEISLKLAGLSCALLLTASMSYGQRTLSHAEMYQGIYGSHYDPTTKIATWHCPEEKLDTPDACRPGVSSVSEIQLIQSVQIDNDGTIKTYVLTSTIGKEDCHLCSPIIGMGVFSYGNGELHLDNENPDVISAGAWGFAPDETLVQIGSDAYGFMLALSDSGGGYDTRWCSLLSQDGKTVSVLWRGVELEDNIGAYDPTGREGSKERIHVTAAYKFSPLTTSKSDHYELEVISHGRGYGLGDKLIS